MEEESKQPVKPVVQNNGKSGQMQGIHSQTINIYTQPLPPVQQQNVAQSQPSSPPSPAPSPAPPPAPSPPPPVTHSTPPTPAAQPMNPPMNPPMVIVSPISRSDQNKYKLFEVLKIIQICVCIGFLALGLIWGFYILFCPNCFWSYAPHKQRHYYYTTEELWINYVITFHGFASIFGLIGACGEVICCQVFYAILCTINVPVVYCIIPWIIVCGLCNNWQKVRQYY